MSLWSEVRERAGALLLRRRRDLELDEELQDHVERETAARVAGGMPRDEARRQALVALGGWERTREEVHEARGMRPLEDLAGDVRFASRLLRRNPGFVLAAVLVLGLGLGAATAVFSVVDAVLVSGLPYPAPERLVRVYEQNSPVNRWSLSTVDAEAVRDLSRAFEAFGVVAPARAALTVAGAPEQALIGRATSGFFRALGVSMAAGRSIEPADDDPSAAPVIVVSNALARRGFGGAAAAVGQTMAVDGVSHTIVGVLPAPTRDLAGLAAEAWPALHLTPPTRRGPFWLRGIARMKPDVTLDEAAADLAEVSARIFPVWESGFRDRTARLTPYPLRATIVGGVEGQVRLFAAAVALVLLIAIANVSTLMLMRASGRRQELAVRAALGASRQRVVRLVVTECLLLAAFSGLVALAVAAGGIRLVGAVAPELPRGAGVTLDVRGLAFLSILVVVSGLRVSLPAVAAALRPRSLALGGDDRRTGTGRGTARARGVLVTAEFALALPLLAGAALLVNSLLRLGRVDPGYEARGVVTASVDLPRSRYGDADARLEFWRRLTGGAASLPGVRAVALSTGLPPDAPGMTNNFDLVDRPVADGEAQPVAPWPVVTPEVFATLGVPLMAGRLFTAADSANAPPVAVVSRAWAQHYFPGASAVGRRIIEGGNSSAPPTTVVGVVGDVKFLGLAGEAEAVYVPVSQWAPSNAYLIVRGSGDPSALMAGVRAVLRGLDAELATTGNALEERRAASLAGPRRWSAVLAGFAGAAVLLAVVGIYGLLSSMVRERRREIGVRMAFGADPASVTRMVVRRGMRYALTGSLLGLGLTVLAARWLRSLLFGVGPTDPPTLAAVVALILLTAVLGSVVPGWRAARLRPQEALNGD